MLTNIPKHKVFISYHHKNDQEYKNYLIFLANAHDLFNDWSVDTGGISDDLEDQRIRQIIRDDYLQDSSVTLLLVGTETKYRKHVDWELYSSMIDGKVNKRSGLLIITLPSVTTTFFTAAHPNEKEVVFSEWVEWMTVTSRSDYSIRYPYLPDRVIDQLLKPDAPVSVVEWDRIQKNSQLLKFMIHNAYEGRETFEYDLSRPMRRNNFDPHRMF